MLRIVHGSNCCHDWPLGHTSVKALCGRQLFWETQEALRNIRGTFIGYVSNIKQSMLCIFHGSECCHVMPLGHTSLKALGGLKPFWETWEALRNLRGTFIGYVSIIQQ